MDQGSAIINRFSLPKSMKHTVIALIEFSSLFQDIVSKVEQFPGNGIEGHAGIEVTLEANPSDISEEKLKGFIQSGINRLSMGFQV